MKRRGFLATLFALPGAVASAKTLPAINEKGVVVAATEAISRRTEPAPVIWSPGAGSACSVSYCSTYSIAGAPITSAPWRTK